MRRPAPRRPSGRGEVATPLRRARRAGRRTRCRPLGGALAGLVLALAVAAPAAASAAAVPPAPRLSARAATLFAPQTNQTLYAYDAYRELPIASTTKLMTALVVLEHIRHLGTVFTAPEYYAAAADSQIGLMPGERMTVHDLLIALMLPSADDAAEDLAYNVGHRPGLSLSGSVARFVAMMNQQASALGLRQTHYSTPIGLDTPGNYSTAADLVKLAAYDLSHSPFFARLVALPRATLYSGSHVRYVINRNDLVGHYPWINGVKTGHTSGAGYVLVASGRRNGMTLISAVLGTDSEYSRDANSLAVLDYGFAKFGLRTLVRPGHVMARPSVRYRSNEHVAVIPASGVQRVLPRADRVSVRVHVPSQLTGPLPRHAKVGEAIISVDGRPLTRIRLVLAKALPAVSPLTIAAQFIFRPLNLVLIIVLVAILLAIALQARQRKRLRAGKGGLEPA